jgi:hypothetical protein
MEKLLNKLNKESYYLRFNPGENVKTVPDLPLFIVVCSIQAKPSLGYPTLLFFNCTLPNSSKTKYRLFFLGTNHVLFSGTNANFDF